MHLLGELSLPWVLHAAMTSGTEAPCRGGRQLPFLSWSCQAPEGACVSKGLVRHVTARERLKTPEMCSSSGGQKSSTKGLTGLVPSRRSREHLSQNYLPALLAPTRPSWSLACGRSTVGSLRKAGMFTEPCRDEGTHRWVLPEGARVGDGGRCWLGPWKRGRPLPARPS